jgi:phosphoribosylformylglycinamidine cyclo-ligase
VESIDVIKHLEAQGEKAWLIGEIVKNDGAQVII